MDGSAFVNYRFARSPQLPPVSGGLYEYVVAANGIFVRAKRPELEAMIWIAATRAPLRGLSILQPYLHPAARVQARMTAQMFEMAYRAGGNEILFYLGMQGDAWRLGLPEQAQGVVSVHPLNPFAGGAGTALEVHSHHGMNAFFSKTDDKEESAGFRVYAVIGDLERAPAILTRVGIYGHFQEVPSTWIFDLPRGVRDGLYPADDKELQYVDVED
jgi:PRTRC genetic system protein A